MASHVVQSPEWGKFKTEYGTPSVRVGNIQYTIHKIPLTSFSYAYCPKVDPFAINWENIKNSLHENSCIAINFDVPNVIRGSEEEIASLKVFGELCTKAPRNTFAKHNILLDIGRDEQSILEGMHRKHRYNLGLSQRKGVTVKQAENEKDFDVFYTLLSDTAVRQKYFIHPKSYYHKIWEILKPQKIVHILTAYLGGEPLASWMLFSYDGILYYPYGGSSESHRNLFASTLVAWEAIRLGKELGCHTFDMWGAAKDPSDTSDPWYGFTNFKLKFGGKFVEYLDSYDYVVNRPLYESFNLAQELRWKLLRVLR